MTAIQVQFPTDVFAALRKSPAEVAEEIRLAAAVVWYARGLISQGKAAEIAGLSRAALIDLLAASGVSPCQETLEEIEEALSRERE